MQATNRKRLQSLLPNVDNMGELVSDIDKSLEEQRLLKSDPDRVPIREIRQGKSGNSALVVDIHEQVIEVAVSELGTGKIVGFYEDLEQFDEEGFTAEEIERHVSFESAV